MELRIAQLAFDRILQDTEEKVLGFVFSDSGNLHLFDSPTANVAPLQQSNGRWSRELAALVLSEGYRPIDTPDGTPHPWPTVGNRGASADYSP